MKKFKSCIQAKCIKKYQILVHMDGWIEEILRWNLLCFILFS